MEAEALRMAGPWARWCRAVGRRVRLHWVAKMLATTLGIPAFFVAYFWVLRHPYFPVTVMPFTALDRWIEFRPGALPLYVSLWVYVSITPALLKSRRELGAIGLGTLLMSTIGFTIFMLWPTAVPAFAIDMKLGPGMAVLRGVDVTANACPSLHVAFAVFNAIWLQRLLRETEAPFAVRAFNVLWCLAIVYSTLATRQHVVLDVLAGIVLGAAIALPNVRVLGRPRP
jgi:PAP2 superfamily